MKITNAKLKRRLSIDRTIHYFECSRSVHDKPCFDALWIYVWSGKLGGNVVNWQRQTTHIQQRHIIGTKCCITSWINGPIKEQSEVNPALLVYYLLTNIVLCLRDYVSVYVSEGFKGGTRGSPIMPRDASLSDSKCWNGGQKWVNAREGTGSVWRDALMDVPGKYLFIFSRTNGPGFLAALTWNWRQRGYR